MDDILLILINRLSSGLPDFRYEPWSWSVPVFRAGHPNVPCLLDITVEVHRPLFYERSIALLRGPHLPERQSG